ncbi:hypothetical protein GCM10017771_51530 [Streptomyces capitiformicae]|uniref:Uncharacterized protein n=1 Tax=Streptomyces capitiformicae TaxID=2014920 RepID=A0A918Z2Z0_9ACTN|nr:hypothetical protein GCM10017771_51530 [Streptomyces capitiformicae]
MLGDVFAAALLAGALFAAGLLAGDLFAAALFTGAFFAAVVLAGDLFAGGFFAAGFLAGVFFTAGSREVGQAGDAGSGGGAGRSVRLPASPRGRVFCCQASAVTMSARTAMTMRTTAASERRMARPSPWNLGSAI